MVTRDDVKQAALAAGVCPGDILLVHSSFKSLGPVEGGAETVIAGLLDALGESGTLVLPTFVQKDFANAYNTWHINKPSDTGYLTEYFRKLPGVLRSDQSIVYGQQQDRLGRACGACSRRHGRRRTI